MQKTFPGLGDQLRKYDEWWKAEGRNQVVAIVTDLVAKSTQRERRAYLDSMLKKYASDAAMVGDSEEARAAGGDELERAAAGRLEPDPRLAYPPKVATRFAVSMARISNLIRRCFVSMRQREKSIFQVPPRNASPMNRSEPSANSATSVAVDPLYSYTLPIWSSVEKRSVLPGVREMIASMRCVTEGSVA